MSTINIRVDEQLKESSETILDKLGLSMTTAMTIFLKAVVRTKGIPFSIELPNEETIEAINEVKEISNGKKKAKKYANVSDLRKDLKV